MRQEDHNFEASLGYIVKGRDGRDREGETEIETQRDTYTQRQKQRETGTDKWARLGPKGIK